MSLAIVRRASALGLALVLGVAGTAFADTLTADGDALAVGTQTSVHVGEVVAGSSLSVDVGFVLTCRNSSHLTAGATIAILPMPGGVSVPDDGELAIAPGSVSVPATWPAPGTFCSGTEPAVAASPARLDVVAPTVTGQGRTFDVLFMLDNDEVVSNTPAFTVVMDVISAAPDPDPDPEPDPDPPTPPALEWTAAWERPLSAATPALVTKSSRTVPLKVALFVDGEAAGPDDTTPALSLVRRASCDADEVLETRHPGALRWADGRWTHQLDTAPLDAGCWGVGVSVDGETVTSADIRIVTDGPSAASRKR